MPFRSSQGTTFTWDGDNFLCIDISYETSSPARERIDMSTLNLADNAEMVMVTAPLKPPADPKKFSITYKSEGYEIEAGTEATLSCDGKSGTYRCTAGTVSLKANQYVEGTATFEEVILD